MFKINQVTSDTLQTHDLILSDGSLLSVTFYFVPQQLGWYIRELSYVGFKVQGLRITNNFNILHQFRNEIPFGLACISKKDKEPMQIEDFESENSTLYILTTDEVLEYERFISGQ